MLQAKTKEQLGHIAEILGANLDEWSVGTYPIRTLQMEEPIPFDKMAEIVDYLRSVNKPKKKGLDLSIVSPEMREPVETWLAYKKEKGQMYKPTAFKTFYRKFCELCGNNSQVAMAIVEQSIQNNYAGIFPLRNNNNNNGYERETITDKIRRTVEHANEFSQKLQGNIGEPTNVDNGDTYEAW